MEKHRAGVEQAQGMLDVFASLGVQSFDLTQTSIVGRKLSYRSGCGCDLLRCWIPNILQSAIASQRNVIIRPRGSSAQIVQLDDLNDAALERVRQCAFLTLTTSPGNHQAWLAVLECTPDWVRRLRFGISADANASGATRIAGSLNFKQKYAPQFPRVQLLAAHPGRTSSRAELEGLGLVSGPAAPVKRGPQRTSAKQWPSYQRCIHCAPLAHNSDKPDISRADFTFCLLALDWGWSTAEICQRLSEQSPKARLRGEPYVQLTVLRAAEAFERRSSRR